MNWRTFGGLRRTIVRVRRKGDLADVPWFDRWPARNARPKEPVRTVSALLDALPWPLRPGPAVLWLGAGVLLAATAAPAEDPLLAPVREVSRFLAVAGLLVGGWALLNASARRAPRPPSLGDLLLGPWREIGFLGFVGVDLALGLAGLSVDLLVDGAATPLVVAGLAVVAAPAIVLSAVTHDSRFALSPALQAELIRATGAAFVPVAVLVGASFGLLALLVQGALVGPVAHGLGALGVLACYRAAGRLLGLRGDALGLAPDAEIEDPEAGALAAREATERALFGVLHRAQERRDLRAALEALDAHLAPGAYTDDRRILVLLRDWSWPRLHREHGRRVVHRAIGREGPAAALRLASELAMRHDDFSPYSLDDLEQLAAAASGAADHHLVLVFAARSEAELITDPRILGARLAFVRLRALLETGDPERARAEREVLARLAPRRLEEPDVRRLLDLLDRVGADDALRRGPSDS